MPMSNIYIHELSINPSNKDKEVGRRRSRYSLAQQQPDYANRPRKCFRDHSIMAFKFSNNCSIGLELAPTLYCVSII